MNGKFIRHDHTSWLIHFVRDRIPEQDFPGEYEDECGFFAGGEIEWDATAFQVLTTIIRLGGIKPGYSFRNGRSTIYGKDPVVCATEMPLYSFAKYAQERKEQSNVSAYGLAFLKREFYQAGGRPAIYGLSTEDVRYMGGDGPFRVIDKNVLPINEQYRYVAYNPAGSPNKIDWSHEREWRWKCTDKENYEIWEKDYDGAIGPTEALPIFKGKLDGRPFSRVCIIVWTREEAKEVQEILTGFYFAGSNNYSTPFDKDLILKSKIIVLDEIISAVEKDGDINAQTIEGIEEAKLLNGVIISTPPSNVDQVIDDAMKIAENAALSSIQQYINLNGSKFNSFGFAHVVTYDLTNPIIQRMIERSMTSGPFDGELWINVKNLVKSSSCVDFQEYVCSAVAKALREKLEIEFFMTSSLD